MKFAELVGGSYKGRALAADAERTINLFTEQIGSDTGSTKTSRVLLSRPGLNTFATLRAPNVPHGAYTSIVLKTLTTHIPGATYDAYGVISYGLPWGAASGGLFAGPNITYDNAAWTLQTTSTAFDPGPVNTGAGIFNSLYTASSPAELIVSFYNAGTLFGSSTPPDQLLVYDCWIEAGYADGSLWRLRPTISTIAAHTGDVQNPQNGYDNDQTTYTTVERGLFSSLGTPTAYQVSGFELVEMLQPPADPNAADALANVRALCELNDRVFAIGSLAAVNYFFELHPDGSSTRYPLVLAGDRRPQMCASQSQVLILSAGLGYIFDQRTNTLVAITDVDFPVGAIKCDFMDGYFIVLEPNSQTFAISALNDGTSWDALDFGDAEGEPGNVVSMIVDHRQVWFLGNNHGELYYDSGDANFPLARLNGAFFEQGCGAIDSLVKVDNSIFWLGRNRDGGNVVWRANGYTPQRVSTYAIEDMITGFGDTSNASAYCYQDGGHTFYRIDFPSANNGLGATLVYDVGEQEWHERTYWDATLGVERADLARIHVYAWGKHLVGDYLSGNIYVMSDQYNTDNGAAIRRVRSAPDLANGGMWTFYSELRLLVQAGVGLDGDVQGSDPQIALQISNDGGMTWGPEKWRSLGRLGDYRRIIRWAQLGRSNNRAFRLICSEPVKFVVVSADLDVVAGR